MPPPWSRLHPALVHVVNAVAVAPLRVFGNFPSGRTETCWRNLVPLAWRIHRYTSNSMAVPT